MTRFVRALCVLGALGSCVLVGCTKEISPGDGSGGTGGSGGTDSGNTGGRSGAEGGAGGVGGVGGAVDYGWIINDSCSSGGVSNSCDGETLDEPGFCLPLDFLQDPCSAVHTWAVHEEGTGGQGPYAPIPPQGEGDGACPAPSELFWGSTGGSACSSLQVSPACQSITRQRGNLCCYTASTMGLAC